VAGDLPVSRNADGVGELLLVEVAQAPGADLPRLAQLFEGGEGVPQRMAARPVQEVAVEMVRPQPPEGPLAGLDGAAARGVLRQHLAHQEDLAAPIRDRLSHHLLHAAVAVHLRGVDVIHPRVEPAAQRLDGGAAVVLLHVPGPLADDGDLPAGGSEDAVFHRLVTSLAAAWTCKRLAMVLKRRFGPTMKRA